MLWPIIQKLQNEFGKMKFGGSLFTKYFNHFETVEELLFNNPDFTSGIQCVLSLQYDTADLEGDFSPAKLIKENKLYELLK